MGSRRVDQEFTRSQIGRAEIRFVGMEDDESLKLPSKCEFLEMLKSAQKAMRESAAEAARSGSPHRARRTQTELLLWDSLIAVLSSSGAASL